jgi:arylsulfatase A-like enzyme
VTGRPGEGAAVADAPPAARPAGRRRATLALAALLAVAAAAWAVVAFVGRRDARPNVLLLVMDTARGDRFGFNGYDRPTTPRMDAFARDAVVYRDAWSPSNWTGPAHASLFTGLRLENHGFYEGNLRFLAKGADTLAMRLAEAGWATGCFSNNTIISPSFGLTQGFEFEARCYERPVRPYPWARWAHDEAADWAIRRAEEGKPFFLFVNDMEPHMPYEPPADQAARFLRKPLAPGQMDRLRAFGFPQNITFNLGVDVLDADDLRAFSDLYDAEIATLDAEVGRLLDRLAAAELLENTLVVILSDHGESFGEHHMIEHGFGLHRALLHVPLVIRYPARADGTRAVDPGTTDEVVRVEDVYPTILEVCGLPVPSGLDGHSLTRGLPGRVALAMQPPQPREMENYVKQCGPTDTSRIDGGIESAYDGRWHYVRTTDGRQSLFDVDADPAEAEDLFARSPEIADRLRALLPPRVPVLLPPGGPPQPK